MSRYYLRPDQIYYTGMRRPPAESVDIHAEVEAIARAFPRDPSTVAGQYGPQAANVPSLEPVPGQTPATDVPVGPTTQQPTFIARFFGRK